MTHLSEAVKDQVADLENEWKALLNNAEGMEDSGNFTEIEVNIAFHKAEEAEGNFQNFVDLHSITWNNETGEAEAYVEETKMTELKTTDDVVEALNEVLAGGDPEKYEIEEALEEIAEEELEEKIDEMNNTTESEYVTTYAVIIDENAAVMINHEYDVPEILRRSTNRLDSKKFDGFELAETVLVSFNVTAKNNRIIKQVSRM